MTLRDADCPPPGFDPAPDLFAGRVALVTGAGAGIGRAVALGLARHGADVVLLGRSVRRLEAVHDEIEASGLPRPAICPLDLERASYAEFEAIRDALEAEHGRLDILLHNAAALGSLTPLEQADPTLWARVIHANLHAPFMLTHCLWPLLRRGRAATVLYTLDGAAAGRAYWGAYGVSKAALAALAAAQAAEVTAGTGVRVDAIDPGPVATALRRAAFPGEPGDAMPAPERLVPAYLYALGGATRRDGGTRWHPVGVQGERSAEVRRVSGGNGLPPAGGSAPDS